MYKKIVLSDLYENKIIIYGAGFCGLAFSDMLLNIKITPKVFFDTNITKQVKNFNNINVSLPYMCHDKNTIVIICLLNTSFYSEIEEKLLSLGYERIANIYELTEIEELFINQPLIFYVNQNWKEINMDNISKVISSLSDKKSVDTYKGIIDFICKDYNVNIDSYPMVEQYFAYDVYKKSDDEVFVDCGAFRGDILKIFMKNNENRYKRYIAIEPDPDNYNRIYQLQETQNKDVRIIEEALSDKEELLKMKNYMNENSVICDRGFEVHACTLDSICLKYNIEPTFIKIDVEGYEEKLLNGAYEIISMYKPIIAIAIYHKCDDLWKLPLKIKSMLPNHRLFIRSYMNVNETVLYVVPEERVCDEIHK